MAGELIIAALVSGAVLTTTAVVVYRTANARPRPTVDTGECSGDDCRQCAALLRHPSQALARQALAEGIKPQTRKGW